MNYDYRFIIKELGEEFKGQFICLGENTEKYITSSVPIGKEVKRIGKNEEELQKPHLTDYNLLIGQDFWQGHYQILFIILLKKFIKLNVNTNMIITNVKHVELNTRIVTVLEYTSGRDYIIEYKCLCCNKTYLKKFDENFKKKFANT